MNRSDIVYAKCMQKKSDITESSFLCGFMRLQNSSNLGVASKPKIPKSIEINGLWDFVLLKIA